MKIILLSTFAIVLFFLVPLDSFAEPYWGNLDIDIDKSIRISGDKSDVVMVKAEFKNNDDEQITIYHMYVRLDDSKNREFSHSNYFDLQEKGHDVTERDCPWDFGTDLNPGISEDLRFCFEVPKEKLTFTLHIYESDLDWCKNPSWGSCQEKTVRLTVNDPAPESSSSSSTTKQIDPKSLDSDADIMIAPGSSVPGCEESRSCYIPYRFDAGKGSTITWENMDSAAHTITSGTPERGPNGIFDSSLIMAGATFSHTFDKDDVIDYHCMVHPWMEGKLNITRSGAVVGSKISDSTNTIIPQDTTPPKLLKPKDIVIDAESQEGAKTTFEVLSIDDTERFYLLMILIK
jgi:plastocyanin